MNFLITSYSVFTVTLLVILYVFVGYPLLIRWLARRIRNEMPPAKIITVEESLTVLMVACNEEKSIRQKLENLLQLEWPGKPIKIVVVDDASDDATLAIAGDFQDPRIQIVKVKERSGKANGINEGMKAIQTTLVLMVDARQEA